jgi:transcriptional regulator with XRE-family HTH domain
MRRKSRAPYSRLLAAPPFPVETALRTLGKNLRIARLRRNLTVDQVAEKIGVNRKSVLDAEKGKLSTSIAIYAAILWALDLLGQFATVADPAADKEGLTLALARERSHARRTDAMDNDF